MATKKIFSREQPYHELSLFEAVLDLKHLQLLLICGH